jgi:hypothetical protein
MKFSIERIAPETRHLQPHPNAREVQGIFRKMWEIDINTLEELRTLSSEAGDPLMIDREFSTIWIVDDRLS